MPYAMKGAEVCGVESLPKVSGCPPAPAVSLADYTDAANCGPDTANLMSTGPRGVRAGPVKKLSLENGL